MTWRMIGMTLVVFMALVPFLAIPEWLIRALEVISAGIVFMIIRRFFPREPETKSSSASSNDSADKKQESPTKNNRPPVDIESADGDRYIAMDAWQEKRSRY